MLRGCPAGMVHERECERVSFIIYNVDSSNNMLIHIFHKNLCIFSICFLAWKGGMYRSYNYLETYLFYPCGDAHEGDIVN